MILIKKNFTLIIDSLLALVILFTVFNFNIVNLPMTLLVIFTLFFYKKINKISNVQIAFGLFASYLILNGFIQLNFFEKKYGLLLITLLSFNVSQLAVNKLYLLRFFVLSCLGIVFYGVVSIISFYLQTEEFNLTVGPHINEILILERPYLGFLSLIAISVSFFLFEIEQNKKWKFFAIFSLLIFTFYLFIISARMAIITLFFLAVVYFMFYLKLDLKKKSIVAIIGILFVVSFFSLNDSLKQRFEVLITKQDDVELLKNNDPRMIIWPCATKILGEPDFNYVFGFSSTKLLTQKLVDCYSLDDANLDRRNYFVTSKFNTHNQYLDLLLTNGIIGLILFILFIYSAVRKNIKTFSIFALWLAFAFFCITENVMYRQNGFYLLILIIFFSEWMNLKSNIKTNNIIIEKSFSS